MSTPSLLFGRSRTWPFDARTLKPGPRYLPMVRAFAGDSTITRLFPRLDAGVVGAFAFGAAAAFGAAVAFGARPAVGFGSAPAFGVPGVAAVFASGALRFALDSDPVLRSVTVSGRFAESPGRTGSRAPRRTSGSAPRSRAPPPLLRCRGKPPLRARGP